MMQKDNIEENKEKIKNENEIEVKKEIKNEVGIEKEIETEDKAESKTKSEAKSKTNGGNEDGNRKKYIAFVCTGNTCRSPMAQAIFNNLADTERVEAESFGISTASGLPVSEKSVLACREIGIDLGEMSSTAVSDVELGKYERFYCMSASHARVLFAYFGVPSEKLSVLNVSDPYGGDLEVYRACRDEIYNSVKEIIKEYSENEA